jgi:hypothetical protein
MRKFISSFGGFSVKAFTNRDFVGVRIWLTPPLPDPPYRHLAPRSLTHHQATVAATPWPHPMARASLNSVQTLPKANSGRSSLSANHTTSFFFVSGFGSGAYSAKLLTGTKQRFLGSSQASSKPKRMFQPCWLLQGLLRMKSRILDGPKANPCRFEPTRAV